MSRGFIQLFSLQSIALLAIGSLLATSGRADSSGGDQSVRAELTCGVAFPTDDHVAAAFDWAPSFGLGIAARSGARRWMAMDLGVHRYSGLELAPDPTFELSDETIRVIPVRFGFRWDLSRLDEDAPPATILLGAGLATAIVRWEGSPELGDTESSSFRVGPYVELQPQFRVGDAWHVFVRQRFTLLGTWKPEARTDELDLNDGHLTLGVSREVN